MKKLLTLSFLPASVDAGLLVLRLLTGASLVWLHGWSKLTGFNAVVQKFPNPLASMGIPTSVALGLAVFAEVVCAALIVLGLATRLAAFILVINMSVAFFMVHKGALSGPQSGELALMYLGGFFAILLAGPGKFSIDRR